MNFFEMRGIDPFTFLPQAAVAVPTAKISSAIREHIAPGIGSSIDEGHEVTVQIVGFDLPNLTMDAYQGWRDLLENWLEQGVRVEYVALDESENVKQSIASNRKVIELIGSRRKGRIEILLPKNQEALPEGTFRILQALREEYRTSHFLLAIDHNDSRLSQMWLEGNHPPGETVATDCYVFGPDVAHVSPEYIQNRANFSFLKEISERALVS